MVNIYLFRLYCSADQIKLPDFFSQSVKTQMKHHTSLKHK